MNTRIIRFLFATTIALAIALSLFLLPMPVSSAPTAVYSVNVNTTTDEYNTGSGCSLREAIKTVNDSANFGGCLRLVYDPIGSGPDQIFVPAGTYSLTLPGSADDADVTGDLDITTPMIISATGAVTVTGGASWADRIFHVVSGTVTIKGVTIRGGSVSGDGGGAVRIESGQSLTLNDSLLANSQAISRTTGGGIYNLGALALNNVTLSSNTANNVGGGIYNGGIATLTNVTLSGNSASCTSLSFNNFCSGSGGGIANNGTLTLTNVTFSDNSAVCNPFGWTCSGSGGGIVNGGGGVAATLTNVTFSGNSALCFGSGCVGGGGGIANSATLTLTNVTLSGNSASNGGGIYKSGGSMTFINTIVANSLSGSNCNTPIGGNSNLSSDGTCNFGAGRDNVNVMLGPLANNGGSTLTHMLLPGSPAIDFGTNTGCPSTDQRGASRPIGTTCDVGAVEASYLFLPLILK